MSTTLATPSVSVALGRRFRVEDLEDQILHTTAAMASYNPKVVSSRDFDDDDFDFEYFSRTYKPLSNLPTPPPSNRNSVSSSPVLGEEDQDATVDASLLGPSVHLVNLHPPGASVMGPSTSLVQTILSRAALPLETIALAVCILDSLDAKFSRKFRMSLPLATGGPPPSKRHTITSAASSLITHIDSVAPELIILTALMIAFKFTDDCQEPTQYFASAWGKGLWTCDQINATERCIMEHLGYRILPLCEQGIIDDAVEDMRRAGVMALKEREAKSTSTSTSTSTSSTSSTSSQRMAGDSTLLSGHARSISVPVRPGVGAGEAVLGLGLSLTPVDTPTEERQTELGVSM